MELSINTPALFFPAISLLMLAYTNRFLALASLIRNLHDKYHGDRKPERIVEQIKNLRRRLHLIRLMQAFGIISLFLCVLCMLFVFARWESIAAVVFIVSMIVMMISLIISLSEIQISTKALEIELSDVEDLGSSGLIDYIKSRFEKED